MMTLDEIKQKVKEHKLNDISFRYSIIALLQKYKDHIPDEITDEARRHNIKIRLDYYINQLKAPTSLSHYSLENLYQECYKEMYLNPSYFTKTPQYTDVVKLFEYLSQGSDWNFTNLDLRYLTVGKPDFIVDYLRKNIAKVKSNAEDFSEHFMRLLVALKQRSRDEQQRPAFNCIVVSEREFDEAINNILANKQPRNVQLLVRMKRPAKNVAHYMALEVNVSQAGTHAILYDPTNDPLLDPAIIQKLSQHKGIDKLYHLTAGTKGALQRSNYGCSVFSFDIAQHLALKDVQPLLEETERQSEGLKTIGSMPYVKLPFIVMPPEFTWNAQASLSQEEYKKFHTSRNTAAFFSSPANKRGESFEKHIESRTRQVQTDPRSSETKSINASMQLKMKGYIERVEHYLDTHSAEEIYQILSGDHLQEKPELLQRIIQETRPPARPDQAPSASSSPSMQR